MRAILIEPSGILSRRDGDGMLTLSVIGVEQGAIIALSPDGERFRLPVNAALRARLQDSEQAAAQPRLSPREIQAHVRAGMTAEQVATLAGMPVASIERFVGPVLAERAYMVESALAVRLPPEAEGARSRTFGAVMGDRLAALAATGIRWSGSKAPSGWVLMVTFTADDVQHDARWRFDPKRMQLDPENVEASTLSQRGNPAALTPRLRAIEPTAPVTVVPSAAPVAIRMAAPDSSRFDSAVFALPDLTREVAERRPAIRAPEPAPVAARHDPRSGPTTDQLASLARRRGQRESVDTGSMPVTRALEVVDRGRRDESGDVFAPRPVAERPEPAPVTQGRFGARPTPSPTPGPSPVPRPAQSSAPLPSVRAQPSSVPPARPFDASRRSPAPSAPGADRATPAPHTAEAEPMRRPRVRRAERRDQDANVTETLTDAVEPAPAAQAPGIRPRRGRTSMPSWDEIVFGRDER